MKKRKPNQRYKIAYHNLVLLSAINTDEYLFNLIWKTKSLQSYFGEKHTKDDAKKIYKELWEKQIRRMPVAVLNSTSIKS